MSARIDIYAICPECKNEFNTGLYAWDDEGAAQIITGLANAGTMIWIFDKSLELQGRKTVPNELRCYNCDTLVQRTLLGPTARAVPAAPQM